MWKKVEEYIEEWNMLKPEDIVIAGVSGGADSMCLLDVLDEDRKKRGFGMAVVHVNHGLRGAAADADEEYVRQTCSERGIPCEAVRADVKRLAKERKLSEEEAGREARREAFAAVMEKYQGTRIALAHHQEDNAETFFMHLARGSRLKGLGGIYPVNGVYIRPLLCVGRKEIETYLAEKGIDYCMDASNLEDTYMRNRIRHHVIPYFREQINARTVEHVCGAMEQLREIEDYLGRRTEEAYRRCVCVKEDAVEIRRNEFKKEERLLQGRVLHLALVRFSGREKDIEEIHVNQLMRLMEKQSGRRLDLPYGMCAVRTYEGAEISMRENKTAEGFGEMLLDLPADGELNAEYGEWKISCRIFKRPEGELCVPKKTYTKWFDYGIIKQSVVVRTRRAGDRITVNKDGGTRKLKSYFIDEKIPAKEREKVPLIAEGSQILWIVGFRQSKAYQVTERTTTILEISINGGT